MNHKFTKATICAVAAAMLITGSGYQAEAALSVKAALPAAGLGLVLGEGVSVGQIRDDVKQKKAAQEEQKETTTQSSDENGTSTETEAQTTEAAKETVRETETASAAQTEETSMESAETMESSQEQTESAEKEIIEAIDPVYKETETSGTTEEEPEEEKETLIIAQVTDYVNIRDIPSTDGEIVGKLYNNSVGTLIEVDGDWYKMKSGSVVGYVKAEYFEIGDEAKRIADEVGNRIAIVNTETLRVRYEASLDAPVLGLVPGGEELTVLAEENGFVKVSIEEGDGWVSMDYVILETEYVTAESVEEERARLEEEARAKEEAKKAAEAAEKKLREEEQKRAEEQRAKEEAAAKAAESGEQQEEESGSQSENAVQEEPKASTSTASVESSVGAAVANYALQFVGNPYKYGGTSLTNGADCSGFVMSVYKNFGVSLPHSSSADRKVGYAVASLAEAQPGDLICYSGHVAIYIGGGQIVHASTEATGIKVSNATYRNILAIRRIF